jgi:hypothetical protein
MSSSCGEHLAAHPALRLLSYSLGCRGARDAPARETEARLQMGGRDPKGARD